MSRVPAIAAPLLLAASACIDDGEGASGLLIQDQVQVGWQEEYNGRDDGLGALAPVDVMAYDVVTGEPEPGVDLHVWTDDGAVMPVPSDGVTVLDSDLSIESATSMQASARAMQAPARAIEIWDAEHDEFVGLDPSDDLELRTDRGGVARLYLYVDAFPETTEGFAPVRVVVTLGESGRAADGLFWLAPR